MIVLASAGLLLAATIAVWFVAAGARAAARLQIRFAAVLLAALALAAAATPMAAATVALLVLPIAGIALAQHNHHGDENADIADPAAATFGMQMMQAMDRMDAGMMAAKPTGDVDRDFAAMMIPHHQGAVDMAKLQLQGDRVKKQVTTV